MTKITTTAIFFLAAGLLTSVSILSVYQVLIVIPMAYYFYLAIKEKDFKLPMSAWFLLAFFGVALLSLIINLDLIPQPFKNFKRLKYPLYGAFGILVFKVWIKEATDKTKKILMNTFLLSIVIAGLYSCYTYFTSDIQRATGLTETMRYGYGSAFILLMLLSSLLHHDKTKNWLGLRFGIVAFIIGFLGMYFTFTRGALLGLLCGLPFVLYFYRPKLGLTLGGLALLGVLGLVTVYLFGSGQYESRFLVNKNNNSDVIRRSQWKAAIIAIQEKPILGWGLSNFHSQLKRIKNQYDLDAKDYDDAHSHNLFLEVGSGTGLIGLFLFVGWLFFWAIESFRQKGLVRALIIPFGVAYVISSQFEVTFDANNATMVMFVYALSVAVSLVKTQNES